MWAWWGYLIISCKIKRYSAVINKKLWVEKTVQSRWFRSFLNSACLSMFSCEFWFLNQFNCRLYDVDIYMTNLSTKTWLRLEKEENKKYWKLVKISVRKTFVTLLRACKNELISIVFHLAWCLTSIIEIWKRNLHSHLMFQLNNQL